MENFLCCRYYNFVQITSYCIFIYSKTFCSLVLSYSYILSRNRSHDLTVRAVNHFAAAIQQFRLYGFFGSFPLFYCKRPIWQWSIRRLVESIWWCIQSEDIHKVFFIMYTTKNFRLSPFKEINCFCNKIAPVERHNNN